MGKQLKRFVDPMAPLDRNNLPIQFTKGDVTKGLPKIKSDPIIGDTGSSIYTGNQYKPSGYDDPNMYLEDLPNLEAIRGENQGFLSALGNGLGRAVVNIIPTVIGNTASILDFEDYFNRDNEIGNSITRAMEDFKARVNKDYLPMYGESTDMGDSAWWLSRGSSLLESIGAFAITGAGIGAGFNALGKGLSMINGLSKLGQAGKAAATLLSATGLNQAESITTAMQVYDTTYQAGIQAGQSDSQAKESAAEAASYSININRANIALNLTSAGAFIRNPSMTRQLRHAFTGAGGREMLAEGGQEYLEETINYASQKEGERLGQAKASGKDYKYQFQNTVDDVLSAEGIESGILGFIGGAGQTGLTRVYNRMTGEGARQDQQFLNQQDSIARIQGLQNAGVVPSISNVFNSIESNTKLQKDIDDAIVAGNDGLAKQLQYQLLNTQLSDALENGTVDQLESVYTNIESLSPQEAEAKGLDTDPKSPTNYKRKAAEAIQLIKDVEDGYLNIANKGYVNPDEVLDTYIQGKVYNRLLASTREDYNKAHTEALQDKLNLDITADLNSENPPKELTDLPSYDNYKIYKNLHEITKDQVIKNNAKYAELTSDEYQAKLFEDRQAKLKEGLEKAEAKVKAEENKEIKKRQKEVKKKVDDAAKATEKTPEVQEVPLPTETDIPIDEPSSIPGFVPEPLELGESGNVASELEVTDVAYGDPVTPEEKATANIVEQEETNEAVKQDKEDGKVKPIDTTVANEEIKYNNLTRQRDVANTVISLNVEYIETTEVGEEGINTINIQDRHDEDGNLIINENFDSRMQSPNQFTVGTVLTIYIPSFNEIGGTYTQEQFDQAENDIDSFPIAFTDSEGKIVGYLPTQENVSKRVNEDFREVELLKNRQLREFIFNNRDKNYTVKITRKSPGSLLTNKTTKGLYSALGNGTKLADGVTLGIFKDSSLQTSLGASTTKSLINKSDLQTGYMYSILPTAETGNFIATPMDVNPIGLENGATILKLVQLYKASDKNPAHKSLIQERNELAREVDLSNNTQFAEAVNSIMYTNSSDDAYMFKLTKSNLVLGATPDMSFNWDDVMNDTLTQANVIEILAKRYHAVQLSKFGQRFNQYKVDSSNKLQQIRHNNYFDYLNSDNVVKTNVQGFPVTGTNNEFYFTGQSVIEFSSPIQEESTESTIEVAEPVIPTKSKNRLGVKYKPKNIKEASLVKNDIYSIPILLDPRSRVRGDVQRYITREIIEEVYKRDKQNFGIQPLENIIRRGGYTIDEMNNDFPEWRTLLPDNKNRPQVEEDFNFIASLDNKSIDEQASELMKKCQG